MRFIKKQPIILSGLILLVLFLTTGCLKGGSSEAIQAYKNEKIVYWKVWDNESDVRPLMDAYRAVHPNVSFEYRKLLYDEYERELLEAFADDRGPDVFSIHNTWLERYKERVLPMPAQITLPVKYYKGTIKKEEVTEMVTYPMMTALSFKDTFLDQVSSDVILQQNVGTDKAPVYKNSIYGIPLSLDTLVMFSNKDLMDNVGIVSAPTDWVTFREDVMKMTKIDAKTGEVLVAGTALGTSNNIPNYFDILSLLMMQNQAPMLDDNGNPAFDKSLAGVGVPAIGALEYYVEFALPLYQNYSWNVNMPDAFEAFKAGKVGYFFGYSHHRDILESQGVGIRYEINPVPQVGSDQIVNYASYWVEVVSKKTKVPNYAWDFVNFITKEDNVKQYLADRQKTTVLRSKTIINEQLNQAGTRDSAEQLLTAKSWFKGLNPSGAEEAFANMINLMLSGEQRNTAEVLKQGISQVSNSIKNRN